MLLLVLRISIYLPLISPVSDVRAVSYQCYRFCSSRDLLLLTDMLTIHFLDTIILSSYIMHSSNCLMYSSKHAYSDFLELQFIKISREIISVNMSLQLRVLHICGDFVKSSSVSHWESITRLS